MTTDHLELFVPDRDHAMDHDRSWSVYFSDPWGNLLEVTTYDYANVPALLSA